MRPKAIDYGLHRRELIVIMSGAMIALVVSVFWLINSAKAWKTFQIEQLLINGHQVAPEILIETFENVRDLDKSVIPGRHLHAPAMLAANLNYEWYLEQPLNREILISAFESAQRALAREPADAFAWAHLAYFKYLIEGPSQDVQNALRMSMYISPANHDLIFWRLKMALLSSVFWDKEMNDLMSHQILSAWLENPVKFVKTAIFYDLVSAIRAFLSAYPEQLAELESLIAEHESK